MSSEDNRASGDHSRGDVLPSDQAQILESLYKRSVEIVAKNKTLSLLSKLYELGIQTLSVEELSNKLAQLIREELSFEFCSILLLKSEQDCLTPAAISFSKQLDDISTEMKLPITNFTIPAPSKIKSLKRVIVNQAESLPDNFVEVFGESNLPKRFIQDIQSAVKAMVALPLTAQEKTFGVMVLGFNRPYEILTTFEKESIASFVDVISLALEKARLYAELQGANEQLRENDRQKDELLGLVSHQLATPISGMRWNLEMFAEGDLGDLNQVQKESLELMQGVIANLSDLVSMILDVSRIQLGRMKVDKTEINIPQFFKEMTEVLRPKSKEKKQEFIVSISADLKKGFIDKRLSHMTIENLLSNAVKYTPEGGRVQLDATLSDGRMLVCVADTGCGIPRKDQDKIFGKLYRASNVASIDGNGFGLFIAKGAIESQGGKIWFESEEGKGTKFFVELPIKNPTTTGGASAAQT